MCHWWMVFYLLVKLFAYFLIIKDTSGFTSNTLLILKTWYQFLFIAFIWIEWIQKIKGLMKWFTLDKWNGSSVTIKWMKYVYNRILHFQKIWSSIQARTKLEKRDTIIYSDFGRRLMSIHGGEGTPIKENIKSHIHASRCFQTGSPVFRPCVW